MIPKKLLDEINRWITEKRYGNLQINFSCGKIVNVNRNESIKIDMLVEGAISQADASITPLDS
jgi:hypothetical protein